MRLMLIIEEDAEEDADTSELSDPERTPPRRRN